MKKTHLGAILGVAASILSAHGQGWVLLENYNSPASMVTYGAGSGGTLGTGVSTSFKVGVYWAPGIITVTNDPTGIADPATLGPLTLGTGQGSEAPIVVDGLFESLTPFTMTPLTNGPATLVIVAFNGSTYATSTIRGHSAAFQITPNQAPQIPPSVGNVMSSFAVFSNSVVTPPPTTVPVVIAGPATNPANSRAYYLLSGSTWTEAEAKAVALGGHLVTINDAAENDWVFINFSSFGGTNRELWIGLNDAAQEGTFVWSSGEPVTYTRWYPGEPNGFTSAEDYTHIWAPDLYSDGTWDDHANVSTDGQGRPFCGVVEMGISPPPATSPVIISGPITNNGHAYLLLSGSTWTEAESKATILGGHLVTINDAAENDWVFTNFSSLGGTNRHLWIGLNDAAQEGNFVWSSGEPVGYTFWYPGEPNNYSNDDYAHIWAPDQPNSDRRWNDAPVVSVDEIGRPFCGVVELAVTAPPSPATCITPPSGLVSWWPGESNALDALDGNAAVPNNGAAYGVGKVSSGFLLDGINDYFRVPASSNLNVGPGTGFTLETWINPSDVSDGRPILEWDNDTVTAVGLHLWIGNPGVPAASAYLGANLYDGITDHGIVTGAGSIIANTAQHVALTYDRTSGVARLFINGVMMKEQTMGTVNARTTEDLYIGARLGSVQPRFFKGIIDEPSVYNRALTTNEIAAIYAADSAGKCVPVLPPPPAPGGIPLITSFSPSLGSNGTVVTLTGTNFSSVAASNIVYFGAVRASVSSASPTTLTAVVPAGATYAAPSVTVAGLTGQANSPFVPTFDSGGAPIDPTAFAPKFDLAVDGIAQTVLMGDVDGDGKTDLVTPNGTGNSVSVRRNISASGVLTSGSFAARVDFPLPGISYGGALADVDGDGKLDIIAANGAAGTGTTVAVLRNTCTPGVIDSNSFAPRVDFNTATGPTHVAVGDLDGDGKLDLAVATYQGAAVSVLRNTSTPGNIDASSFAPKIDLDSGATTFDVRLADLDRDGRTDLVVARYDSGVMTLIRNQSSPGSLATSSFAPNVDFAVGNAYDLAVGDLDGDAKPDVAVARHTAAAVAVLRNTSTAGALSSNSFATPVSFATGSSPHGVAIGDLDGDGKPDLATANENGASVSVLRNTTAPGSINSGSFAARIDFATGSNPVGVAIGDLDGDSRPDLAASLWASSSVSVLRNILTATPPTITQHPADVTMPVGSSVAFNSVAAGSLPLAYQWRWNGTNIAGATNAAYNIAAIQDGQAGLYSVRVTNQFGAAESSNALLTVLPPPSCLPPPPGLVSWWPGESNATDVAGPNVGVLENGTSFIPGKVAGAFNLDGVDDRIRIPASSSLNVGPGPGFTLEAWINPFNVSFGRPIFEWNNASASAPGLLMWVGHPGSAAGYLGADLYDGAADHVIETAAGTILSNTMQHVVLTYERTNGVARLFINGIMVKEQTLGQVAMRTTQDLYIGARLGTIQPKFFQGIIDEPGIYNRALTTNEIAAIFAAGSTGKCPIPPAAPTITQHPTNRTVVAGSPATFASAATGSSPLAYQWRRNGTNIAGATNAAYSIAAVQENQAGLYSVRVTNLLGVAESSNALLTVLPPPSVPVIYSFAPGKAAAGEAVQLVGTNFSSVPASNIVYFGAVQAMVVAASPTNLTVVTPSGATFAPPSVTVAGLSAQANTPFLPIYLGAGVINNSSFAPKVDFTATTRQATVATGDLDGDGKPDLMVANIDASTVSVYRNISSNGIINATSFAPRISFPTGTSPYASLADVDGDGKLDILVANNGNGSGNTISILRNTSTPGVLTNSSFAARVNYTTLTGPLKIAAGDLDGDGRIDLAVSVANSRVVSLFRNIGTPGIISSNTFAARVDLGPNLVDRDLALADLDGDGKLDMVVTHFSNGTVSLLRNIATRGSLTTNSFAPKVTLATGSAYNVTVGDLDGDGKLDLAVDNRPSSIGILRNLSTPGNLSSNTFAAKVSLPVSGEPYLVAIGDVDGDGKPDLAASIMNSNAVAVLRNTTTPGIINSNSFAARVMFATGSSPRNVVLGDLDADGRPDLAVANLLSSLVSVLKNTVPPPAPPSFVTQPISQTVVLGDQVVFTAHAAGALAYQWQFNGDNLSGQTNSSLILSDAQLEQAGGYTVVATNHFGPTASTGAVLTVTIPSCVSAPSGLVAWWPGNGDAMDSVSTNNGLSVGGVTYVPAKVGTGFRFTGSGSYIRVPHSTGLNFTDGLTVELWFKDEGSNLAQGFGLIAKRNGGAPCNFGVNVVSTGLGAYYNDPDYFGVSDDSGSLFEAARTFQFPATNRFHHFAATWRQALSNQLEVQIYLNGLMVRSKTMPGVLSNCLNAESITIGADEVVGGGYFTGIIDDVSLYNRALGSNEITGVYAARGAGKCPIAPTVLNVTPPSWFVNEGQTVSFTALAVGTPPLSYQWQSGSNAIVGVDSPTLTLSNVVFAQSGNYSVAVSNIAGMTISSNVTLFVNRAPVADAGATVSLVVSLNGTNALATLNGSHSSDPDSNILAYAWFITGTSNSLATGAVASVTLPLGTNQLTLVVSDGLASGSQNFTVEVITVDAAFDELRSLVLSGNLRLRAIPLLTSLRTAQNALDHDHIHRARARLRAFQFWVRVMVQPDDPDLAAQLIAEAQAIIVALGPDSNPTPHVVTISSITLGANGRPHLRISGQSGRVYVVEVSTNTADWVPLGEATETSTNLFEFDDNSTQLGARFYRVVAPE